MKSVSLMISAFMLISLISVFQIGMASANPDGKILYVDNDFTENTPGWGIENFTSIQSAIDAASPGDTINVAAGTYSEALNLGGKALTIDGAGADATVVDASSLTVYAIQNFGDSATVRNLKLVGSSNYGFKVSHVSDITLENIRVEDSGKTGVDLNTVNNATLTNIEVVNTVNGFGLMILDSSNVEVTDIATSNNAWGGVSIQTAGRSSDSITFSGNFDAQEDNPLLLEEDPPTYYPITNVVIPSKFEYVVYAFREGNNYKQTFYQETLDDAKEFAQILMDSLFTYADMNIHDVEEENYYVIEGMSIQSAIDAASPGDTVLVGPGTYEEDVTVYVEDLMLIGVEGPGNTVLDASGYDFGFSVQVAGVTIDNFAVANADVGIEMCGEDIEEGSVTIRNNVIENTSKGIFFESEIDGNNVLIENNSISNNGGVGMYFECYMQESEVGIVGNTIENNDAGIFFESEIYDSEVGIVGNTIENNDAGIVFEGEIYGSNILIESNSISNNGGRGMYFECYMEDSEVGIAGNTIENNEYGISIEGDMLAVVNYNNIVGNTEYGIYNETATIDATLNWWGDPTGPRDPTTNPSATGDDVSGDVNYTPWLDAPHPGGSERSWNVQNADIEETFNSIQDAIDAASPGDTVLVGPGTYAEDIQIGKPLTVRSTNGAEETIIRGSGVGASYYMVRIYSSDVTFEGFTVTNPTYKGGADASGILVGAYLGGSVENVHILNNIVKAVRSGTTGTPSMYGATGINIGRGPLSNVVVSGNTIENIHNPEGASVDHTCGMNVWDGAENIVISNNAISDIKYNGILLEHANQVQVVYNTVTGSKVGIAIHPWEGVTVFDLTIHHNNIAGNREYGVLNTMTDFIDATLNWWGDSSGPGGVGLGTGDNVSVNVNYASWLSRPLPTISGISVSGVTTTSATITWTTALPADSRVKYSPTIAYGLTSSIPYLTTSHSVRLTGLTPSTTYHFMVRSEDAYGHVDNYGDLTFITAAPPPPTTLTVNTTPIKANVYVDGSLWGVAPRTKSLAAGAYMIYFGDVLGYLTPAPKIVTLAASETRTVTGVYKEIPPENIKNQSPTYDIPSITPEENATIPVENSALTEITVQVKNAAENVKITVQEVTEGAAGIAVGAPGATYKYLNIVTENITDTQIGSVVIRFKVEKSWIIANDIDIATITLNRYDPLTGEWTSLPTTYLSEDDTYVYFSAISPGLSIFGVSGSTIIPANFELSNLVITPSEVSVGKTVTISVVVNNAEGRTESTTVTLEINGVAVDTRSVTLDAGKSTTVTFTVSEDVTGTYTVNVAGLTGSFVVTTLPALPIVPLAVSIIIIVLAISIVMWLWRIRRRA